MISRRSFLLNGATVIGSLTALAALGCSSSPFISELELSRGDVVPDGTGVHDEADVYYTLSKRADVSAIIVGPDGKQYLLRKPQTRSPDRYMIPFRGLIQVPNQNWLRVVPDGTYRIVVTAKDAGGVVLTREASIAVKHSLGPAPPRSRSGLIRSG